MVDDAGLEQGHPAGLDVLDDPALLPAGAVEQPHVDAFVVEGRIGDDLVPEQVAIVRPAPHPGEFFAAVDVVDRGLSGANTRSVCPSLRAAKIRE